MRIRPHRSLLWRPVLWVIAVTLAAPASAQSLRDWEKLAEQMVAEEIVAAGVENERVVEAMRSTPRHEFVPLARRKLSYLDMALPIGSQQTISPPFVVAYMTEQLDPQPTDRVLEIGTGSGYQAAVLSPLVKDVYSIEIVPELGRRAARVLERLELDNVHTRIGDGYLGWPEAAPFDRIIVTCSPEKVPQPLVDQLAEGGVIIVPVGERFQQNLYRMTKVDGELKKETLRATLFVPMTGEAEEKREALPDPANPHLDNGGFEIVEGVTDDAPRAEGAAPRPAWWHYLRQFELVSGETSPEGSRHLRFFNDEPGRGCRALQGFAVDGRAVSWLRVRGQVRGDQIRKGPGRDEWPYLVITFYNDRRAALSNEVIGPFRGSFDWTQAERVAPVPLAAREAIVRIGLLGAVGEIAWDDLSVEAAQ
ncbi:Protein-L-isoaspartate O-methyltransferase [Pseudobythopirellula maris]|uniref:Protein-L-isoaspartate O-methyltransferase n=1 Tax=Pseudobythopirellula maris TaxID=2527991 RepID=A0A5C5ZJ07_9BACT|nr:protein-L-isoaspartate(D-aspartate) O-methyltransferase [Pseudobythopirellula maris]TWT86801.1 Protein-L-isoaspartate O-methyltransferase [Pseudobythopirellula maris]